MTHFGWAAVDNVEGIRVQVTNADRTRTFAEIHRHGTRLYVLEAAAEARYQVAYPRPQARTFTQPQRSVKAAPVYRAASLRKIPPRLSQPAAGFTERGGRVLQSEGGLVLQSEALRVLQSEDGHTITKDQQGLKTTMTKETMTSVGVSTDRWRRRTNDPVPDIRWSFPSPRPPETWH